MFRNVSTLSRRWKHDKRRTTRIKSVTSDYEYQCTRHKSFSTPDMSPNQLKFLIRLNCDLCDLTVCRGLLGLGETLGRPWRLPVNQTSLWALLLKLSFPSYSLLTFRVLPVWKWKSIWQIMKSSNCFVICSSTSLFSDSKTPENKLWIWREGQVLAVPPIEPNQLQFPTDEPMNQIRYSFTFQWFCFLRVVMCCLSLWVFLNSSGLYAHAILTTRRFLNKA